MKLILVLAFTMPAPALAKDYCESLAGIQSKVNYCDENTAFVKPAEQCRDLFAANIKAENLNLGKKFGDLLKKENLKAQAGSLALDLSALKAAENSLSDLITEGNRIFSEVSAYQEGFVLPIYAGYEEDFNLDPHSAKTQEIFRDKECYGEPMADLDAVKADVKKMIKALEETREKLKALQLSSESRKQGLDASSEAPDAKTKGKVGKGAGEFKDKKKKESTITGVEESKKKEHEAPKGP